jgi:Glyoxalase-like domain
MLKLDHLTVIAPTLAEGVSHVRACLDLEVPFGQRHGYMGTCNHLLQLGDTVYLEIVALDPQADGPGRRRWFGLDDQRRIRSDWDEGRRLRAWVARTDSIEAMIAGREGTFGEKVSLPPLQSSFDFAISPGRRFLSTALPPRSSTGAGSLARCGQSPIWVRGFYPSRSSTPKQTPSRPSIERSRSTALLSSCGGPHCGIARKSKRPQG